MAKVEVYINGVRMGYGTTADGDAETKTNMVDTFDGQVNSGSDMIPHKINLERLVYGEYHNAVEMNNILKDMLINKGTVTLKEEIPAQPQGYTITRHYTGCLVTTRSYTIKPTENTVEKLSFSAEDLDDEWELL